MESHAEIVENSEQKSPHSDSQSGIWLNMFCYIYSVSALYSASSAFPVENPLQIIHLTIVVLLKASCHLLHLSFPEETNKCVNLCSVVVTLYITSYSDVVGQTVMNVSWGGGKDNFENLNKNQYV